MCTTHDCNSLKSLDRGYISVSYNTFSSSTDIWHWELIKKNFIHSAKMSTLIIIWPQNCLNIHSKKKKTPSNVYIRFISIFYVFPIFTENLKFKLYTIQYIVYYIYILFINKENGIIKMSHFSFFISVFQKLQWNLAKFFKAFL